MSRQSRHQSVVNRQSDEGYSGDHWLKQFEDKLQKTSVQPRGENLYDQISSIMNSKSKYPSVQAAVDDMMQRSGLTSYLENVKTSTEDTSNKPRKTAQTRTESKPDDQNDGRHKRKEEPKVFKKIPGLKRTLENIMRETRGNLPISAIIARLQALHAKDTADVAAWEDEDLLRMVSKYNLEAKKSNPGSFERFDQLGTGDHSTSDRDIDPSNTDAFNALMPSKI